MSSFSVKCANSPTNEINSPQDSPNSKKKAKKFSMAKPMRKTAKSGSEEQPTKFSDITGAQYKLAKDRMDQRDHLTNT